MKYLIILLLSFSALADVRIEVSNIHGYSFEEKKKTQQKANNWIANNIANDSWGKKERWEVYREQTTCLVIEDVLMEILDLSVPFPDPMPDLVLNAETGEYEQLYEHPTIEVVDYQRCRMPVEYTIVITDITQEVQDEKDAKEADRLERLAIRRMLKKLHEYNTIGEWRQKVNKLLRRLIKDRYGDEL